VVKFLAWGSLFFLSVGIALAQGTQKVPPPSFEGAKVGIDFGDAPPNWVAIKKAERYLLARHAQLVEGRNPCNPSVVCARVIVAGNPQRPWRPLNVAFFTSSTIGGAPIVLGEADCTTGLGVTEQQAIMGGLTRLFSKNPIARHLAKGGCTATWSAEAATNIKVAPGQ
jgi:hypothetical protein